VHKRIEAVTYIRHVPIYPFRRILSNFLRLFRRFTFSVLSLIMHLLIQSRAEHRNGILFKSRKRARRSLGSILRGLRLKRASERFGIFIEWQNVGNDK